MADANAEAYLESAPHLKHARLTALYRRLVADVCALAGPAGGPLRVLDLGAGEGSATLAFLEAGAEVVAVDDDADRLELLSTRAHGYRKALDVRRGDAVAAVAEAREEYDVVAAVSFLHHVPDYEALAADALAALRPGGVFFSFQDPLLYASLGGGTRAFARAAYLAWRVGRGDVIAGAARYARRRRRGFDDDLPEDAEEFHAQRGGVDQRALVRLLQERGVPVRLALYFSTQSTPWQRVGTALGLTNTFAVIGGPVG